MAAAGEEVEKKAIDSRLAWLRTRLTSSLRCKDLTLDRLFANEDSALAIASFVDSSENRLLVYDAGKGDLAAVRRAERARQRYPNYAAVHLPRCRLPPSQRAVLTRNPLPCPTSPRCRLAS